MPRRKSTVSHDIASDRLNGIQEKLQEVSQDEVAVDESKKDTLKDIRELIFLGRKTLEVKIDGFVFVLQTLKGKENEEVVRNILMLKDEERVLAVKNYTLAFGIKTVNGFPLKDIYNQDEELDDFDKCLSVLDELDVNLTDYLFQKYTELKNSTIKSFENKEASETVKK